jgi:DNA-binding transcriptional regulator YiaG
MNGDMEVGMQPIELKQSRARLGLTQDQLATTLGVHRLSVSRWESGVHRIPNMLALAIRQLENDLARDSRTLQTEIGSLERAVTSSLGN